MKSIPWIALLFILITKSLGSHPSHINSEVTPVPPPEEKPWSENLKFSRVADFVKPLPDAGKIGGSVATPVTTVLGALSGKIVYLMAGHGWTARTVVSPEGQPETVFSTQRSEFNDMVEDFGNLDQVAIVAEYLLNTGATVVPVRPFGFQEQEVVLDNDDTDHVTFFGSWNISDSTHYYGSETDSDPFLYSTAVAGAPTSTAVYDATGLITKEGFYPVYAWALWGTDRINQTYIVEHSGGLSERKINHQKVGAGWVYLGTFYFQENGTARVTITNSDDDAGLNSVAIADAIRWGNGMGDNRTAGIASGFPRHEENASFWLTETRGIGSGLISVNSSWDAAAISAHMNYNLGPRSGATKDRVYLSFHSNGATGSARGADGLFNTDPGIDFFNPANANEFTTPNGGFFANELGTIVNRDMSAISNTPNNFLPVPWGNTGFTPNIFGSGGFGIPNAVYFEINNDIFKDEMAATIIETAFHDNQSDALTMRDPRSREAIGRAVVHGVINFMMGSVFPRDTIGSSQDAPYTYPPEQPENVHAISPNRGDALLHWTPPVDGGPFGVGGDAATGYLIEASGNGRGFSLIAEIPATESEYNISNVLADESLHYFRVTAKNEAGVSNPSVPVAARKGFPKSALIVNGFDRFDGSLNRLRTEHGFIGSRSTSTDGGTFERVIPRFNNRFDYIVEIADALTTFPNLAISSCQNEQVDTGEVDLNDYDAVFWILGAEDDESRTFNGSERNLMMEYLDNNGSLFVSGSEIGFDLGRNSGLAVDKFFLENYLKIARFNQLNTQNNAVSYSASGEPQTIFEEIGSFHFSDGSDIHGDFDVSSPDELNPFGETAVTVLRYDNNKSAGVASDDRINSRGRVVTIGFPVEVILAEDKVEREEIIISAAKFFDLDKVNIETRDNWLFY